VTCDTLLTQDDAALSESCEIIRYMNNCPLYCDSECSSKIDEKDVECVNIEGDFKINGDKVTCDTLLTQDDAELRDSCEISRYMNNCPLYCDSLCISDVSERASLVDECENTEERFTINGEKVTCATLLSQGDAELSESCKISRYMNNCPIYCNSNCGSYIRALSSSSSSSSSNLSLTSSDSSSPSTQSCRDNPFQFGFNGKPTSCAEVEKLDILRRLRCKHPEIIKNCPTTCQLC